MATQSKSSQEFVPIKEIRDGIVVMKDGSMKLILMASSLNLALKSQEEQTSIILQFQNFLNSLDFSVQFFIQSRKYDIRPYLAILEERERGQLNDLLKIQTREYIGFIKNFVETTNIMTKNFFIIIPYSPPVLQGKKGMLDKAFPGLGGGQKKTQQVQKLEDFESNKSQLLQRSYVVQQGLIRSGVRTVHLGTEEAVELFYRMFNPGEQEKPIPIQQ